MVTEITSAGITLDEQAVRDLQSRLHGEIVRPGDEGYDAARSIWQGGAPRRPALIVRCADENDVIAAVTFAREQQLPLSVRSGGHAMAGHGLSDGVVIDLSGMKAMFIDPLRRVARAQPGLTWGEYAERAQAFGLATSSGDVATVGVGGLTVGGGIGWMVRKHGLTIDHLLAVEVVTADGRLLRASETENADLFWAVRGGGGNFGVVTAFEFRLHPAGMVLGGAVIYPGSEAVEVLQRYARFTETAPDELTTMALVAPAPPAPFIPADQVGKLVVLVLICYNGDLDEGERAVAPLRRLGTPIADIAGPMPYSMMYALTEEAQVRGRTHTVRSMFTTSLDEKMLRKIVAHTGKGTAPMYMTQIRHLGGAMSRVPAEATAFAHRNKPYMVTITASWDDPAETATHTAWTEKFWEALRPYADGVYVNFLAGDGAERLGEAYPPATYERLVAIKRRYDPANLFRVNQNIAPAGGQVRSRPRFSIIRRGRRAA